MKPVLYVGTWAAVGIALGIVLSIFVPAPKRAAAETVGNTTLSGFERPESVVAHPDGRVFVSEIGGFGVPGDGKITQINPDFSRQTLAEGLDDPKGLDLFNHEIYVTDIDKVWRIGLDGSKELYARREDFPVAPTFLNDLEIDGEGNVYVSDSGREGQGAGIDKIAPDRTITRVLGADAGIASPNGLLMDGLNRLLVADFGNGTLFQVVFSGTAAPVVTALNSGFGGADGLVRDSDGLLYVSDWKGGKVWQLTEPRATPQLVSSGHQSAADIGLSANGKFLLVPDMQAGELVWLPIK